MWQWNYTKPEQRELRILPVRVEKDRDGEVFNFELAERYDIMTADNMPDAQYSPEDEDEDAPTKKSKKGKGSGKSGKSGKSKDKDGKPKKAKKRRLDDDDDEDTTASYALT